MVSLIVFERSGGGKKTWLMSLIVFERCGGGRKTKQKKNLSGEAGGLCTTNVKESLLRGLVATSFVIFFSVH